MKSQKKVQLEKIKDELKKGSKIFYFDRDNSHKDMMALVEALEKRDLISILERLNLD